ncbi:MAG: YfhO family protein [Chitinophagaceae bacterium]
MNKGLFRKILPHLIAFLVFLVVAVIYCKPALEGQVLAQHDITQWEGAMHQSVVVKEQHGHAPLWTNSMFGGMPTFQIGYESHNKIPGYIHSILTLGLPAPIQFFFLSCICFYFLCIVLRANPYIGIMGALAFAYATYNPVIIVAGHSTKMWAMAYMPAILASLILIYEKKYWIGAGLTALFSATMIAMNHPQIAYYFFIAAAIMTIFYVIRWIKQKEWKHLGYSILFTAAAGITGVLVNAENILSTYEYQKETIRGGASTLTDPNNKDAASQTGLDKDYAFSYSMGITEPFVMMVPRIYGGSDGYPTIIGGKGFKEMNEDNSKALEALQAMPQELGQQIARSASLYWGGIGSTTGPPYVGAIVCFLAILSLFLVQNKHRWWALTAIVLAIMMSWGSYFKEFNYILYDLLPFYNKFRAPSMILVIPQLLLPMLAVIGTDIYIKTADKKSLLPAFKKGLIATGVVFVVLFLLYMSFDFLSANDNAILKQARGANQPQLYEAVKPFFDGLKADRKGLMLGDIFRSLGFIAVAVLTLFFFIRNSLKPIWAIIILTFFAFIDVIVIDAKYLNSDNYQDKVENQGSFQLTKIDEEILKDKSYYRVFNFSGDRFAEAYTSYHYNSLGGYHAVKLRLYQDMIEKQLSQQPSMPVLNMLNAKYFIQKDQAGLTQQYQKNDSALGPVWLVKNITFVKNADQEMAAITNFNPKDTAIVQESFKRLIPFLPLADSAATVQIVKNENDLMTYNFNASSNQFAVFSEIYYEPGWKAFIDGKETPIVKTNYVLRGIAIPAGKHSIEMKFEPPAYMKGKKLTTIFSVVLLILVAAGIFMELRRRKAVSY